MSQKPMKILVIGEVRHFEECREKLGEHDYTHFGALTDCQGKLSNYDLVFDFLIADEPEAFQVYAGQAVTLFANIYKLSLLQLAREARASLKCTVFGFNGFPTLFNREFLEVSLLKPDDGRLLEEHCRQLNTKYLLVDDRIGMVTPRVICMIINEAYFTVQEGTASREDIDLAMKLGTNYPYGPFEWCDKIGLKDVYELVDALYRDTKDERYKISALMKKEYLRKR
jgi:3-hydroxybutyryl-CoA dehydrogenase